jgi:predicted alpha/beta hydrolase
MQYTQSFLDVADQRLGLQVYPEPAPDAPLVVIWPAMGVPARYYQRLAANLHAERFAVVVAGVDVEAALGQVHTPVLAISLDGDGFTPAPTVDLLAGKFIDARVRRVHLSAADMGRPVDHFTWVRASTPVASRIAELARTAPEPRPSRDQAESWRALKPRRLPGTLLP